MEEGIQNDSPTVMFRWTPCTLNICIQIHSLKGLLTKFEVTTVYLKPLSAKRWMAINNFSFKIGYFQLWFLYKSYLRIICNRNNRKILQILSQKNEDIFYEKKV